MLELEHLMPKVIEELRKRQDYYIILSDEDYVKSKYFNNPNRKHVGKQEWIHCIDPDTGITDIEVYFKSKEIAIPLSHKEIRDFETSINVERKIMKPGSKNQYTSLRLRRDVEVELVEDTVSLVMEIINYAHGETKSIHDPILPKRIIRDGTEYIVICGKCGEQYRKADRCTFCGQALKWPKSEDIPLFVEET